MSAIAVKPLPSATFGGLLKTDGAAAFVATAEAEPRRLSTALNDGHGLLVLKGLHGIAGEPDLLLRLSRLFGSEVENYRLTATEPNLVHAGIPEILVLSNMAPHNRMPPAQPDPPRRGDGGLPIQFPHRRGWHTDQSFRRPPPDISLFYAVHSAPKGQGQTLYADGIGAYENLPADLKDAVEGLEGLHIVPGSGRAEYDVRAGKTPRELESREAPQRQPVIRVHPETGTKALYLCEAGQMDWIEGPLVGMEPGIHGDGAALLYELMEHYTSDAFTYAHDWDDGDMVIYDNRSTIHSATWFDAENHDRLMWRTTVWGNPGPLYDGEERSWMVA
ncbi:MAG: TauD/TfdA family dioxygenase [Rhodospirillaceae bacterium]|nr:TauD/TfdA family dioxygenase [Rhodospirillaceae bacterium]